ncbi:hypothetical protein [Streptomyces sp. NPDC101234]|uniref:hypothetical protein n=1 Tax=Streptomyces sp. NPDC101234 TaxID=3366138 RepID=UPI0037F66FBD
MTFDRARFPGQREPGDDRGPVSIDADGEGMETGQVVLADCVESLGQPVALSIGEDVGEGADMSGEGFQLGTVGQNGLESELFDLGEGVGVGGAGSSRRRCRVRAGEWCPDRPRGVLARK